jgi:hypothetical protein
MSTTTHTTREDWLKAGADLLAPLFKDNSYDLPPTRYSCGWPSVSGLANKSRRIGECWTFEASKDKHYEIFISPVLDNPIEVLAVLAHEIVHACVGIEHKHRGPFAKLARAIGLEGKLTSTYAGQELRLKLQTISSLIGVYPHAKLEGATNGRKKEGTRMLKIVCPADGYTVRTTKKWLDQLGVPSCPCGKEMELEEAA